MAYFMCRLFIVRCICYHVHSLIAIYFHLPFPVPKAKLDNDKTRSDEKKTFWFRIFVIGQREFYCYYYYSGLICAWCSSSLPSSDNLSTWNTLNASKHRLRNSNDVLLNPSILGRRKITPISFVGSFFFSFSTFFVFVFSSVYSRCSKCWKNAQNFQNRKKEFNQNRRSMLRFPYFIFMIYFKCWSIRGAYIHHLCLPEPFEIRS